MRNCHARPTVARSTRATMSKISVTRRHLCRGLCFDPRPEVGDIDCSVELSVDMTHPPSRKLKRKICNMSDRVLQSLMRQIILKPRNVLLYKYRTLKSHFHHFSGLIITKHSLSDFTLETHTTFCRILLRGKNNW